MASARLRKTFHYPSDDEGSAGSRDEMDEAEQEQVISAFQSQSKSSNTTYTIVFTLLPLALTPLFIYHLIFSFTTTQIRILSLLSVTSLLASSFIMFFMSTLSVTDARERLNQRQRQTARATISTSQHGRAKEMLTAVMDKLDDIRMDLDVDGPLLKSLPFLNAVISALLVLSAWLLKGRTKGGVSEQMWWYLLLPGAMFVMTEIARRSMIDEQKELGRLKGLKYGYKGA